MNQTIELGFGIMRMPLLNNDIDWKKSADMINEYMQGEFCYFDTHPAYMSGKSQEIVRKLVVEKFSRDKFLLANKMPYYVKTRRDYEVIFRGELHACGVEYFDYYMLHALTKKVYEMHERLGGFAFLEEQKRRGYIKNIGFSFHDSPELLEHILTKHPEIDFVQLQINFLDWESPVICSKSCYEVARKYNKKILVMEPIKGGSLANEIEVDGHKMYSKELAELSLSFVANLDGIEIVLSGMSEVAHVRENRNTILRSKNKSADDKVKERDIYKNIIDAVERRKEIPCTNCRYCVKECPKGIAIPDIISLLNNCKNHGEYDRTYIGRHTIFYNGYVREGGRAGDCIKCGKCEEKCPQKIMIRKQMSDAEKLFERKSGMNYYSVEKNVQMLIYLLKEHGVKKVVASPGATNVCLVYSLQQDGDFEIYSAADERSAAYIACGLAAESGETIMLSCTGATASRNYMPGLTEAYYRKLPILAVTSTQPRDRYGNQIPQFIDRSVLPKDIVKLSVYIPSIHTKEEEWSAEVNLNRALLELEHNGKGPVHINLETEYRTDYSVRVLPKTRVIRRYGIGEHLPQIDTNIKRKVGIFVGAHKKWSAELTENVDSFCEDYNGVVLCDQTSNYKGKYGVSASLITYQEKQDWDYGFFDILIHIGDVSGAYMRVRAKEVWRVCPDGEICDTFRTLTNVFEMEEATFFGSYINNHIEEKTVELAKVYQEEYAKLYAKIPELPFSNIWAAKMLAPMLPNESVLHLAILNSLRSWNFFDVDKSVLGYSNTGGFGIDGCLSSLIGASLIEPDKVYFGIIGDLAFFYDMNALGNRHVGPNVRILLLSNGCGTEFKNYDHLAYRFGKETNKYIAASGHYGNKSVKLVKDYAEDLGFDYISASTKDEFTMYLKKFVSPQMTDRPIVFELFVESEDESNALKMIRQINGVRNRNVDEKIEKMIIPKRYAESDKAWTFVLWGTGACFEKNLSHVEEKQQIKFACDNNCSKWGRELVGGIKCISPEELKNMENVFVIIMLERMTDTMQVANQLLDMGISNFDTVFNWLRY